MNQMTSMIDETKRLISRYSESLSALPRHSANSAVLVPLHAHNQSLWITFIKRSKDIGLHRGQMGFPGGMMEPEDGGNHLHTALRESFEEIGIEPADVGIAGQLKARSTIKTGLSVQPFVGIIPWPYRFTLDHREVQSVHSADLKVMASGVLGAGNRFGLIPPVYPVDDEPVWGLTARIVRELVEVLKPVWNK
jgi:8-oxo-dGTP pyrophosphatase MutT (NUDIX family)